MRIASQSAEVVGDLPIGALVESSDQFDDIAAGVASSETAPEILAARDDESSRVVAAVNGAGATEGVRLLAHLCEQAALGEDLLDGDESLEMAEAQVSWDHGVGCFPFPFPRPL